MAPRKLEQLAGASTPEQLADIQPLLNNSFFAKQAQEEIDRADAAAEAAQTAAAAHEDFTKVATTFVTVMSGLREIAKKFPEVAQYTDEAVKQVQYAMQGVGNQPVKAPSPTPVPAPTPATPTPPATPPTKPTVTGSST